MTFPSLFLGIIISTLYGSLFHFWRGGGFGRLILDLLLGWAGFWIGHFLGGQLGWSFSAIGPLNLGMATLVAIVFLAAGHWLSLVEIRRN